jgi:hypothetical protein
MLKKNPALWAVAKRAMLTAGFLTLVSPVMACPMCKDSAVDAGTPRVAESAPLAFNKSIYIMLGGFISVVGFTGRVMYKAVKSSTL